jgi:hypothetical protein
MEQYSIRQKNRDIFEKNAKVHDFLIHPQKHIFRDFFAESVVLYIYISTSKQEIEIFCQFCIVLIFVLAPKKSTRQNFASKATKI